jgi:hypothetical protein
MKLAIKLESLFCCYCLILLCLPLAVSAQQTPIIVPVNSPAFVFSPGNWAGDTGRGGSSYRQTWNSGAYFRVSWSSTSTTSSAILHLDTSPLGALASTPPEITYNVDGVWRASVPLTAEVPIEGISGAGQHVLTVYLEDSKQRDRWGGSDPSGRNVLRVTGLELSPDCTPTVSAARPKWMLEIGDSITEGIMADNGGSDNLADYSYFVGLAMQRLGYEYGVSACGSSGWLRKGDDTGDVPAYYVVNGGKYDEASSRWDKIDSDTGLLDSSGHISGSGGTHEEPSIITINYGTNDANAHTDANDTLASISGSLSSLRRAAPNAKIFIIIPFGQYDLNALHAGLNMYLKSHSRDKNIYVIDLGPEVAHSLAAGNYQGGLHPNMRGHAAYAAAITAEIVSHLQ